MYGHSLQVLDIFTTTIDDGRRNTACISRSSLHRSVLSPNPTWKVQGTVLSVIS